MADDPHHTTDRHDAGEGQGPTLSSAPSPPPIRRAYTPQSGRARDVDAFERVMRFRALAWSLVGAFLGLLLGVFLVARGEAGWIIAVTTVIGWLMSFFGILAILEGSGRAGATLYAPSGRSTPRKREYSLAESLVARGDARGAVAAFEDAIREDAGDPVPYLRIARLYRDRLDDPEESVRWFKCALAESEAPPGIQLLARKELVELLVRRLGQPRRAAPILARIAEEAAGTSEAEWAAGELARIKDAMREESGPT